MNYLLQMLAQAASHASKAASQAAAAAPPPLGPDGKPIVTPVQTVPDSYFQNLPINDIWNFIVHTSWLQAVVFVAFGMIYLIYGWRIFKVLVIINFAMLGLFGGMHLGQKLGSPLWGGILGAIAMGVVSWPFMKYSVAVLGALAGAVVGGALWRTMTLPDPLIWCGALAGLVAGGFLAFSSFKVSIMLFTSLQGSMFVVIGMLALLAAYPEISAHISLAVYTNMFFLPLLLIVPTAAGIYFQQRLLKQEGEWAMPE
jgi:hypothetical protein